MRTILVASLAAVVAACSIFGDFGQYSTEDAPNGADSGGPGTDSSSPVEDASSSGGPTDGGTDAANDGGGVDAGPPFCASSTHAFCADFEADNALDLWDGQGKDSIATLELSTTHAKGGKRALRAKMPRHETGKYAALLYKNLAGDWRPTHVELDVWVEAPNWQNGDVNASLLDIEYASDSTNTAFYSVIGPDYFNLGGAGVQDTFGNPIPTGKWVHVVEDLTTSKLECTVDGVKRTHLFSVTASGGVRRFVIDLGIDGFNAPVPELDVYYDNVTVDFP